MYIPKAEIYTELLKKTQIRSCLEAPKMPLNVQLIEDIIVRNLH